ncbi:hypothetical protein Tco_0785318 [Tanacetum coccineum]
MDIFAFIHTPDPTKVRVVERERNEDELRLLDTTIGRIVPLLPVAPDRGESELEASVEKLFDEGAVLNAKVEVAAIPTLPFVTASVSSTPEREGGDHTDSVAGLNLRAIGAPLRFIISSDSSHHTGTNVAEAEVDSLVRSSVLIMTTVTTITSTVDPTSVTKEKPVKPSLFCADSSSAGGTDPNTDVFSDLNSNDFLFGAIRTVINPDTDLQKIYMVDEFAPPKYFASVRGMEHDQLFTEFNVGAARQMSLSAKVRMRAEYNVKEKRRLKSVVERHGELLKVREKEIENLKGQLLLREAKAAEAIRLRAEASKLETLAAGKERELTNLNALITSVKSQNDNLVDQVHELETSSSGLQEKVTVYQNCME